MSVPSDEARKPQGGTTTVYLRGEVTPDVVDDLVRALKESDARGRVVFSSKK